MTLDSAPFTTVLVANRGEIACRVIRTLRSMGIRSVAVYSDADSGARHVLEADAAVHIGPAPAADSYLRIDAIIGACLRSGAQAVHPGYGFLAENVAFAKALDAAGIAFIGPGVEAIEIMGDKIRSKNHVMDYGVPCVPGIAKPGLSDADLLDAAQAVGYPLLVKPSAGGGGKGMYIVERQDELEFTLKAARRVAAAAFGDDTLFLERLVLEPRHIEVQILADNHGNIIHLGERECSLQRRHQKVIEEAPSPLLESLQDGTAIRNRLGQAACDAARSVNYSGAGTVEFLVSNEDPEHFYFMEMNTRLQVEHPVTEMVTGVDLVEWQVRIAAGEQLTLSQSGVVLTGHAAEARIYAERPERNFLPSFGRVVTLDERGAQPVERSGELADPHVRIDSAMLPGLTVTGDYDPMLAKVIAWAPDRKAALDRLDTALGAYTLLGLHTNVEYLRLLVNDDEVRAGRLDTNLIERKLPGLRFREPGEVELIAAAGYLRLASPAAVAATDAQRNSPWSMRDGWRLGDAAPLRTTFGLPDGSKATVSLALERDGGYTASVDNHVDKNGAHDAAFSLEQAPSPWIVAEVDGVARRFAFGEGSPSKLWIGNEGWSCSLEVVDREARLQRILAGIQREEDIADPEIRSPMPGTVVAVLATDGESVAAGQALLSVEAMKMEHQLTASVAGKLHLGVRKGDLVKADQVLATIHVIEEANSAPQERSTEDRTTKDRTTKGKEA
ncbi:biotin carboxylase N-terminal domain-containing protein [Arthrobacter sp. ISL-30]|uniref:acetyl/propionyl/methylcrotonyl-CoA carboxylase subunit alpha n=1 Tax=Arthrobacter sp. ISL-30 TaxID=2819109 RepID=UPI001BE7254F|nr:biotin carboxylase N-terminal domain-containing protein [Arthrobacter sp. ISL-30]MBT2514306.1 acetyl/propionyl-CoA carboxylase subunit alpha [Arthrobacter sp. ISL-30]